MDPRHSRSHGDPTGNRSMSSERNGLIVGTVKSSSEEQCMKLVDHINALHDEMTAWRREIHAHPELGFEEQRTSDLVAAKLAEFGFEVFRGIGRTGVVGRLRAG